MQCARLVGGGSPRAVGAQAFLQGMGLSPVQFRELLREAHELMRREAEEERMR